MRIQVINPNTSQGMTDKIATAAKAVALSNTTIIATQPQHGPSTVESAFDEIIASAALMDEIQTGIEHDVDAHIIACFGDPGLDAARELSSVPVIGIAEAAFHMASLITRRFSVVTTMSSTLPTAHHLLDRYGFSQMCASVRATDIPVKELESMTSTLYSALYHECLLAINDDGAEAIVLGCAGMADLVARLSSALNVPVIDGVAAAVKLAESLDQLGLRTAKSGFYAAPKPKAFVGRYQHWSKE
ncbi:aspartate/glutamate racemase family protein [Vibrio sp. CAIM 722]|uniref:Hydantoin racemase n=1 Tax=Vibrio eleionomae TaxID=2653505 RepID=A0A7X4RUC5_9VIBR|nr:aspartate/glutamate racemase family protein [Vibrio eleionomae]MZI93368.1 aspartate/glutamate racemase family protein [Vibrio eleionomae]